MSPQALLSSRLEKLFQSSFPQTAVPPVEDQVVSLKILLGPLEDRPHDAGAEEDNGSPWSR